MLSREKMAEPARIDLHTKTKIGLTCRIEFPKRWQINFNLQGFRFDLRVCRFFQEYITKVNIIFPRI